jgi:hypothetical protein
MDNPYKQCALHDHFGPNLPEEPDLHPHNTTTKARISTSKLPRKRIAGGCAAGALARAALKNKFARELNAKPKPPPHKPGEGICRQINGLNFGMNDKQPAGFELVPDVRIQYRQPTLPCDPCDVTYSVSAAIDEDEYIGVGFKGQSWEAKFPLPPSDICGSQFCANISRPSYFGMSIDAFDNFTSDRIALGYSSATMGACVREMVAKNIIGSPEDVDYTLLKNTSVQRGTAADKTQRTTLLFTSSQHWANDKQLDGPWRLMWAIGKVTQNANGDAGCKASIGYHTKNRGVSPLEWLVEIGSTPCKFDPTEMGE